MKTERARNRIICGLVIVGVIGIAVWYFVFHSNRRDFTQNSTLVKNMEHFKDTIGSTGKSIGDQVEKRMRSL